MEFDWVMSCGSGWFVGPKFLLCDGLGWVGSVVCWAGLSWVEESGPTDTVGLVSVLNCGYVLFSFFVVFFLFSCLPYNV